MSEEEKTVNLSDDLLKDVSGGGLIDSVWDLVKYSAEYAYDIVDPVVGPAVDVVKDVADEVIPSGIIPDIF